jgi:KUP system potassium uptake protein
MPEWFIPIGITVATLATIIASQALISGSFTLVNEAMKLKLWPNMKVLYPTAHQGQMYIPFMNWFLLGGCITVVLIFRESANMEAAYGLAITIDMLMTTALLTYLMTVQRRGLWLVLGIPLVFLPLEGCFFCIEPYKVYTWRLVYILAFIAAIFGNVDFVQSTTVA